jgi:PKHD-type hydroxylase
MAAMLHIPGLLSVDQVAHCRGVLADAAFEDGRVTAGGQSALAKHNLQLPQDAPAARKLGELILAALAANPAFMSAALPAKVFPPLFNLYREGMGFGPHIDNAIRVFEPTGARYRTDLSATLFLSDPADYEGGELVIDARPTPERVKLPAGDLILYPASTVHHVAPVTAGARWASFFWIQSMVADAGRRSLLHDLDLAIASARAELGDAHPAAISLVGTYHNLVRMWCEV